MKTKQDNKLTMFNALSSLMESSKKTWLKVKEIEKTYKSFVAGNIKLNVLKEDYEKSLQSLKDNKSSARKNLINETLPIANVILAFAIENKKKKLVKTCNYSKNELKNYKDLELVEHSKTIWKEAKKLYNKSIASSETVKAKEKDNPINIHNYGLTGQMIDKLEIANVGFIESHLELKDAIVHKNKCRKKITSLIKSNNRLLTNKLDLLISIFKATDSTFYKKYQDTRIISKTLKEKTEKNPKTKNENNTGQKKEELTQANEEVIGNKIIPKRKPRPKAVAVKKIVSEPVVTSTEVSKSSETIPVSKTTVAKTLTKRPPRRKPVSKSKITETKIIKDEPNKVI